MAADAVSKKGKEPAATDKSLAATIKSHLDWFEEKMALIPPELYVAHEDMTEEEWRRKQRKRTAADTAASKEARRAAKRARFDPDAPRATVAELQQKQKDTESERLRGAATQGSEHAPKQAAAAASGAGAPAEGARKKKPIEELKRKVAELNERRKRGMLSPSPTIDEAAGGDDDDDDEDDDEDFEAGDDDDDDDDDGDDSEDGGNGSDGDDADEGGSAEEEAEDAKPRQAQRRKEGQFSTFDYSTGKPVPAYLVKGKQQRGTRGLLSQAVKAKEIAKTDKSLLWDAAEKRSAGQKVMDDPRLLKKKLKREEAKRKKSAASWEERTRSQAEAQRQKQESRTQHLKERTEHRKDRKFGRKPPKQSKKGGHRPGFEGKKKSFINS